MESLPTELLALICQQLDVVDLVQLSRVSKAMNSRLQDHALWQRLRFTAPSCGRICQHHLKQILRRSHRPLSIFATKLPRPVNDKLQRIVFCSAFGTAHIAPFLTSLHIESCTGTVSELDLGHFKHFTSLRTLYLVGATLKGKEACPTLPRLKNISLLDVSTPSMGRLVHWALSHEATLETLHIRADGAQEDRTLAADFAPAVQSCHQLRALKLENIALQAMLNDVVGALPLLQSVDVICASNSSAFELPKGLVQLALKDRNTTINALRDVLASNIQLRSLLLPRGLPAHLIEQCVRQGSLDLHHLVVEELTVPALRQLTLLNAGMLNLKSLELTGADRDVDTFSDLLRSTYHLNLHELSLTLSGHSLRNVDVVLSTVEHHAQSLRKLSLASVGSVRQQQTIRLTKTIARAPDLTDVSLRSMTISTSAMQQAFQDIGRYMTSLVRLELAQVQGLDTVCLKQLCRRSPDLEVLRVTGCACTGEVLSTLERRCRFLRHVTLTSRGVSTQHRESFVRNAPHVELIAS